jgi:hypothetical protein
VAGHPIWPGGGSATPRPAGTTLSGPRGEPPLGPNAQKQKFEQLAQGAAEPTPGPLGVVRPPLGPNAQIFIWSKGQPNHPLGHEPPPGQTRWLANWGGRPPCLVFSFFFFFLNFIFKKCYGDILGINRPKWLNCHNLKVWDLKL